MSINLIRYVWIIRIFVIWYCFVFRYSCFEFNKKGSRESRELYAQRNPLAPSDPY